MGSLELHVLYYCTKYIDKNNWKHKLKWKKKQKSITGILNSTVSTGNTKRQNMKLDVDNINMIERISMWLVPWHVF